MHIAAKQRSFSESSLSHRQAPLLNNLGGGCPQADGSLWFVKCAA